MNRQVVILFGAPGAGKGTQSELISENLGLYLFETSKVLEREFKKAEDLSENSPERFVEIDGEKFDVLHEKELWSKGILCSPPWVTSLLIKEFKNLFAEDKNLILAGSPRTVYEVEKEMPILSELYGKENISIILIEVSAETTIFRNSHRKICELMRHSILFNDETKNLKNCPLDGSKLVKREDLDDPETIKVRLKEYSERTLPMIEYFNSNGYKVNKVNGEQAPADLFKEILSVVKKSQ
jgi:adenylate kinase